MSESETEPTINIPVSKLLGDMERRINARLKGLATEVTSSRDKITNALEKASERVGKNEKAITKIQTVGAILALLLPPATAIALYLIERAAG